MQNPDYVSYYLESVARLYDGDMRPEYVLIPERSWDCADRYYCFQAAQHAILNLKEKKQPKKSAMYSLDNIFYSEVMEKSPRKKGADFHLGRRFLYKINKDEY